ncbi:acyl carrier protein [Flavicella sediminum]|uniref:acyl carrier protein n=1 Tax=Flavicella sediminum TaxID=2585141 RepID=UPI00112054F9|nr:phosphopantetheine-binding protein [Flavicella sediminum]
MGLDSVELAMSLEKVFNIQIPGPEWGKISTIEEISEAFYAKMILEPSDKNISLSIFNKVKNIIKYLEINQITITSQTKVKDIFPIESLQKKWNELESKLELKLPKLVEMDFDSNLKSYIMVFGFKTIKRKQPVTKGTMKQLIDWIISLNYKKIIDLNKVTSKYEIQRIVIGVTSEKIGIPVNEIELRHSITNDLGVD